MKKSQSSETLTIPGKVTLAYNSKFSTQLESNANTQPYEKIFNCPGTHFSVKFTVQDIYTFHAQIIDTNTKETIQTFPIDSTDRTFSGVINKETLEKLGNYAEPFLTFFSKILLDQIGGKQFFVVQKGSSLQNYTKPEDSGFSRFKYCNAKEILKNTKSLLAEYPHLVSELDKSYRFVKNEPSLYAGSQQSARYIELTRILETARFTPGKMEEYKKEDIQGKMSRFMSEHVTPILMLKKETNEISGVVRALEMGNDGVKHHFAYLSDEVLNQEIIPLDQFNGQDDQEKSRNREKFLLAYFMEKSVELKLWQYENLFLIAPAGRESMYEELGFRNNELVNYDILIKLTAPQTTLKEIQGIIAALPIAENQANTKESGLSRRKSIY